MFSHLILTTAVWGVIKIPVLQKKLGKVSGMYRNPMVNKKKGLNEFYFQNL